MWYAIIAAAFLAVGIGLLIWGLRERSARHAAELAAKDSAHKEQEASTRSLLHAASAKRLQDQVLRLDGQIKELRQRLAGARDLLVKHADVPTIKAWLDDIGRGGDL